MKIIKRKFFAWDDKTKRNLKYATLRGGYLRKFMRAFPQSPTIVVFSQKQIMGWAFALCHNKTVNINLFVNERYRKRGLAARLVEEALNDFQTILLAEWDSITRRLFSKLKKRHPKRIIVFNWWRDQYKYDEIIQKASLI